MKKLEKIYRDIQPKIYAFFYVKTSSQAIAEDLTHDVFYEALKSIHTFKGESTLQTWVFSIANHMLKKYYRSNKYKRNLTKILADEDQEHPKTPEDQFFINEETRNLIRQIQALDDLRKEIVTLRIYGELSFKEIGQLVQKSENYVRVNFHRTKIQLKREMEGM